MRRYRRGQVLKKMFTFYLISIVKDILDFAGKTHPHMKLDQNFWPKPKSSFRPRDKTCNNSGENMPVILDRNGKNLNHF